MIDYESKIINIGRIKMRKIFAAALLLVCFCAGNLYAGETEKKADNGKAQKNKSAEPEKKKIPTFLEALLPPETKLYKSNEPEYILRTPQPFEKVKKFYKSYYKIQKNADPKAEAYISVSRRKDKERLTITAPCAYFFSKVTIAAYHSGTEIKIRKNKKICMKEKIIEAKAPEPVQFIYQRPRIIWVESIESREALHKGP